MEDNLAGEHALDAGGHVYILEVKDIQLPVCKIGMTKRSPDQRCAEINKSSTGDFIWAVYRCFSVDDCAKLESLVHAKLSPLRQKRREFFSLRPEDAYEAVVSIIDAQSEISLVDSRVFEESTETSRTDTKRRRTTTSNEADAEYAELLQIFASLLGVKGRPFGQTNRPIFGMSDGNIGVQWNLAIAPEIGKVELGVNLEGSEKTGKWLISDFILSKPNIEAAKSQANNNEEVFVRFSRDAWQGAARLDITESLLGGREYSLAELDALQWNAVLDEALTCLDATKCYRKRRKAQTVTLASDGRKLERDISPHLTIWTEVSMEGDIETNLKRRIADMKPIYDWVLQQCTAPS